MSAALPLLFAAAGLTALGLGLRPQLAGWASARTEEQWMAAFLTLALLIALITAAVPLALL